MKHLIDECLSPELARLAREHGYLEPTHVSWLGLAGEPDWTIARRAVDVLRKVPIERYPLPR